MHHFHLLHFYPFIYIYISTHSPSCHNMSNTQTKNDIIYLQSFNDTYSALTLLFHLILTCMSWLQPRKGDLHFILSNNSNYNFDVKVRSYEFVDFVSDVDVIDCGSLKCVFCFKIKEKEKNTFYINFYSIIFLQSFFFLITSIE